MSETASQSTQRGRNETEFARPGPPALSGAEGVRFDFNYGCRVQVPVDGWRVRMIDLDTFNVVLDEAVEANSIVTSRRKYFVRFLLEVFDGQRLVFSHTFNAANKKVALRMAPLALGDSIAWMPVIDAFREQHNCELHMPLGPHLQPLFREGYPRLHIADEELNSQADTFYATYYIGLLKPFSERDHQPTDPRVSNMQDMIAYLLGVPCEERRPNVVIADKSRLITERYVCIATQSTAQCKYWNNPRGWPTLIAHLKTLGYRVLCIDKEQSYGNAEYMNTMPEGAEDFTGNRPLQERLSLLNHADFFIGLGSGLSWLAWATGTPVVMISGFSHPSTEFRTPYRVINFHGCNSCFNDMTAEFEAADFAWCPRRADKAQRFQCTSIITPELVMRVVDKLITDKKLLAQAF
ncbi:autotransporter strand-loop-strand O-heptosyltransferase [Caballeronia sordidicola]|uniref:Plasmid pIB6 ORFA DNA n=1 Tax=Caballeronia sordidicola TaxID=196367 RepID=A0A242MWN7_CABSO|nr:autotransporter strand-loop-strand O-heptosyltransferase [Caballeronia sordidicola]OTP75795.1 Plasmid pIB6 ORFA DNA [Caballeronia sordidicola]